MVKLYQEKINNTEPAFLPIPSTILKDIHLKDRQWFTKLVHLEEVYPYLGIIWKNLYFLFSKEIKTNPNNLSYALAESQFTTDKDILKQPSEYINILKNKAYYQFFYTQFSPLFKTIGSWLTGISSINYAWKEEGGILLKIHADMVGNGNISHSLSHKFELDASTVDLIFPDVFNNSFTQNLNIQDYAFNLPVFLLSISQFPEKLYPESLGVNLAMGRYIDNLSTINQYDKSIFSHLKQKDFTRRSILAINQYIKDNDALDKINNGYNTTLNIIRKFEDSIFSDLVDPKQFSNDTAMLSLIQKLGKYGHGYHKRGKLSEKPIDDWLISDNFSPKHLLNVLASSRYVSPGHPEKSTFVKLIKNPKGAMFGVFSEQDIDIVETWIRDLNNQDTAQSNFFANNYNNKDNSTPIKDLDKQIIEQANLKALDKYSNFTLQELYPLFLHAGCYPDVLPTAKHFAQNWLTAHKQALKQEGLPFYPYSHERLDNWLDVQHLHQVNSYIPLEGIPEESREDIINDAIGLAPLTLIDGAWLRNTSIPARVNTYIGALQYRTLLDELGGGDINLHHGNIYKQLLKSMEIDIGKFTDKKFATSILFNEENLKVPTFWLAISLFPHSFLPETLGLNLAMELSGVGGEYRRSGDILSYYGFSSLFTSLHNTIDNVVTGHSAWAIDAIKHHLDNIFQQGGEQAREQHWERIWTGYRSLNHPPKDNWFRSGMNHLLHRTLKKAFNGKALNEKDK
ncbi:iron-containing redox enzyme family protein [Acinetobacter sp. AS23]|uniref:iron-containing redox enzyme family protein n=1 Tax=Acinetobacter sp. AS23 TaxID=2871688 RepID=UPI0020272C5A|nr:iron-containing redox enzyme family protein [Acinetobacter sp. AS23]URM39588.1 iron-containing redox enzyme family protein [Acinetobacter sp. AS23]